MAKVDRIEIDRVTIGHLLRNEVLKVPVYQRPYAWEKENVTDLYNDLAGAIANGATEYFLGSIVIAKSADGAPEVVDGQQRLASSAILLAAVRDHFLRTQDEQRAQLIESHYLMSRNLMTLEELPRLHLNEIDHDFFFKRVLLRPGDERRKNVAAFKDSHKKIAAAAKRAAEHVENLVSAYGVSDRPKILNRWVEYLENGARVISVRVGDESAAYVIFETMNDRGLRLSAADLLKNYLFGRADNRIKEVQQRWLLMTGALDTIPEDDIVVTYIRHLWISMHGPTRTRALFQTIKETIKSKQAAVDFSNQLAESAPRYAALLNPTHEIWNQHDPTARKHVDTLARLGMAQMRPLLLAAVEHFSRGEINRFLLTMVCWAVRFLINGVGSGTLEGYYGRTALEIHDSKIKNTTQVASAMASIVPDDEAFESAFTSARVSQAALARYYLRALQLKADGIKEPQYVPNDSAEITLEHILPQSPSADWKSLDEDTVLAFTKRIGNMVLLQASQNAAVGNKPFSAKRATLQSSEFSLTQAAGACMKWGVEEIKARQAELAKLAVQTWPIRPK